ncbi:MAG: glycosyltransferase family 4 protein [Methylacidiphilales bacterium]|nr:glycosyltransferase family 4 protein [Candidatus Methylacidiphilales bacterium]MDW8349890.1 glycosyltransferase family 4 protein [Verrucomicrobiae bacterium]
MKVLFINQVYPPDPAATGQQQAALAEALVKEGHEVTVVTSRRGYDNPSLSYPKKELKNGVKIRRVWHAGLGKSAKWKRAIDFATYALSCFFELLKLQKHDVIVTLTTPPLISVLGVLFSKAWQARFVYWIMDLNPDEAIAAGWLAEESAPAKILEKVSRLSLNAAQAAIVLDSFMAERIRLKGVEEDKIHILPPWALREGGAYDLRGRETFRREHRIEDRFVIMYSGNHSPCHPLDTVLQAALKLREDREVLFCFVGGGTEYKKVQAFREANGLTDQILCLPYQPFEKLAASLSSADLHLVVMGNPFVGMIHPCKIYNVMSLGIPCICLTPRPSHLTELVDAVADDEAMRAISHGEVEKLVEAILHFKAKGKGRRSHKMIEVASRYTEAELIPKHIQVIIGDGA